MDFESGRKFAKLIDKTEPRNDELQFIDQKLEEGIKMENRGQPEVETIVNETERYHKMKEILLV